MDPLPTIFGADTGVQYPHLLATGAGTESSPYTHADHTGGIQAAINTLTAVRGGRVMLSPSRFNVTTPVLVNGHCLHIEGQSVGENIDPNGESEGVNGSKIHATTTAFRIPTGIARPGGVTLRNLYVFGPGKNLTDGVAAIEVAGACDQLDVDRVNATNVSIGYSVPGQADSVRFIRASALNCGYGFKLTGNCDFGILTSCPVFDCDFTGIYNVVATEGLGMVGCRIGRTARTGGLTDPCNVYWGSNGGQLVANVFWWAGYSAPLAAMVQTTAAELILAGSNNVVSGNYFQTHDTTNPAIRVRGNNNIISGNSYLNYTSGSGFIVLEAGASGNVILDQGVGVINNSGNTSNIIPGTFNTLSGNAIASAMYTGGTWKSDRAGSGASFGGSDAGFYIGAGGSFNIKAPGGVTVNGTALTVP